MSTPVEQMITPVLSHRFAVAFVVDGVPSLIDMFFQRVSGFNRSIAMHSMREGGRNIGQIHFPEHVDHGNLVFERGVMTITPLTMGFMFAMENFHHVYMQAVVTQLGNNNLPQAVWTVTDALPLSWQQGDLDAHGNQVLISRMEIACRRVNYIGTKL